MGDPTLYSKRDHASDLLQPLTWLLNCDLTYETLWTSTESGLLLSMLEKLSF